MIVKQVFIACSIYLEFRDTSRNSVEHIEQRIGRRLIAAASADGVGKDFFRAVQDRTAFGSDLGEVSARNLPNRAGDA
jgi:hypothetical protein